MLRTVGASVRGPAHAAAGVERQDAWRAVARGVVGWAAVADGMGSRPAAAAGARAAVAACGKAWRLWQPSERADPADFARLVEVLWRLALGTLPQDDACTTVIFVGLRADGSGLGAQLGDGLLGRHSPGSFQTLTPERESFGSVTHALGAPHRLADWVLTPIHDALAGTAFVLATDGVSDDLAPGLEGEMVEWLLRDFASDRPGSARLRQALHDWPVPGHQDDKTVVLLWKP